MEVHAAVGAWWDPGQCLLLHPGGLLDEQRVARSDGVGLLVPTVWWAYGLLRRGEPGDRELAEVALRGVLDRQYDAPGTARHATWPMTSREPAPDADGRVAVGAALALVLGDHDLPTPLAGDVRAAVERAVDAERDRVVDPTWTSMAVLRAWLELEVGRWRRDEDLLAVGAERARAVAADAGVRGHVAEHISPTATGITLLGLSLWAERPPVEDLEPLGRALRDEVWHDVLAVWHPGLGTLVPPFSRASGMDLRAHVGATGLWLAWLVDGIAPLPHLYEGDLDRAQDLPLLFLVDALAGASPDVRELAPLVRAQPARQGEWFDRVGERVWTGWTGGDLAVGAEWSPLDRDGSWQVVTAAAVWRAEDGGNAWLRLHQDGGPVEARVAHEDGVVRLTHGTGAGPVELWVGGPPAADVTATSVVSGGRAWDLAGVTGVTPVERDVPHVARAWTLDPTGEGIVLSTRT